MKWTSRQGHAVLVAAIALGAAVAGPSVVEAQTADLVAQGRQALDAGRVDEAIATFEKAVAADGRDPAALAWLGGAQVRKARTVPTFEAPGWVKKGFNVLDEAVERFPDAFVVYMVRGMTAANLPDLFRKSEVAVKDLSTVIAMREKNPAAVPAGAMPSVYLTLGRAYKKTQRPAEARATWEKGRALFPSAPEAAAIDKELREL